ncbi:CapA family protein [bacterium]|nr:CapA family protein [bacterium]
MDEILHHPLKLKQIFLRGALVTALLALTACSQPSADFTLTLGGDIMLAREGEPLFESQGLEINPWSELQQKAVLINDDSQVPDYFMANLESPLGDTPPAVSDMNLCSEPELVKVLTGGGVDLVSLANNHRDDCSPDGTAVTKNYLDELNIRAVVMGEPSVFLETPGGRVAVLAAEDVTGSLDLSSLLAAVKQAHVEAQVVVVAMHWGNEYQAGVDERQQSLAQQLADAGADVIWGHHPHVLQKMEWLKSADGRQVLVVYSLGNLLADQWMLESTQQSVLVRLSFDGSMINVIEIIPLKMDRATKMVQLSVDTHFQESVFRLLGGENLSTEKVRVSLYPDKN